MEEEHIGSVHAKKTLILAVSCWLLCGGLVQAKDFYGQGGADNTGDISGVQNLKSMNSLCFCVQR